LVGWRSDDLRARRIGRKHRLEEKLSVVHQAKVGQMAAITGRPQLPGIESKLAPWRVF
jgi:hypothetical protein